MANFISKFWDDITGNTAAERQREDIARAGATAASGAESLAQAAERAAPEQRAWDLRAIETLLNELTQRRSDISGGLAASLGSLSRGYGEGQQAAAAQDTQRLGLIREGMGIDRATLEQYLARALGAQAPFTGAYQQMVGAALPQVLGAMQGTTRMPLSSLAQIQQEDTARSLRANAQRAGLEGSGMASAQTAAANRRIAAEDEQRQMERWMSLLTQGLGGANLASGTINQYASALGNIGNRLSSFSPYDVASQMFSRGKGEAELQQNAATRLASLESGLPAAYQGMGQNVYNQMMNPANARYQGALGSANTQAAMSGIQAPSGLATLGQIAKIGTDIYGMGQSGMFGQKIKGMWG